MSTFLTGDETFQPLDCCAEGPLPVIHQADHPLRDFFPELYLDNFIPGEGILCHGFRQKGQAQFAFHQGQDLVRRCGLRVRRIVEAVSEKEVVIEAPGHGFLSHSDQGIVGELREGQLLAAQGREGLSADQNLPEGHEAVLGERGARRSSASSRRRSQSLRSLQLVRPGAWSG